MKAIALFVFTLLTSVQIALAAQDTLVFPQSWVGHWTGELEIYNALGLRQKIFMGLHIQPTDSAGVFSWEMTYGEGEDAQVRPYFLKTIDAQKGRYLTDEDNSILLDAYWVGDKLIEVFSVQGSLLITTIQQTAENELLWEIIVALEEPVSVTGGKEVEGEQIPEVKSFPVPSIQRARLRRN